MEHAIQSPPREVTEGYSCECKHCGRTLFSETFIATYDHETSSYNHTRVVRGSFRQQCAEDGTPTGPVVPFCDCKENNDAKG